MLKEQKTQEQTLLADDQTTRKDEKRLQNRSFLNKKTELLSTRSYKLICISITLT